VLGHPGRFDSTFELHLAPPPAHLRRTQGGDQLRRLAVQLLGRRPHHRHLLEQLRIRTGAIPLDRVELELDPVEGLAQRADHALDGLLPLGEVAVCARLRGRQLRRGQFGERLVVALQCVAGERGEGFAQPVFGLRLDADPFCGGGALGVEGGLQRGDLEPGGMSGRLGRVGQGVRAGAGGEPPDH
jgi:hypothetical protein